jgi:hypothetical protein
MSKKDYTRVYTVQFVVSTKAENKTEADERIDRVFSGTITKNVADNNGLLDKIWGTFDGVTCDMHSSVGTPVIERSSDKKEKASSLNIQVTEYRYRQGLFLLGRDSSRRLLWLFDFCSVRKVPS